MEKGDWYFHEATYIDYMNNGKKRARVPVVTDTAMTNPRINWKEVWAFSFNRLQATGRTDNHQIICTGPKKKTRNVMGPARPAI